MALREPPLGLGCSSVRGIGHTTRVVSRGTATEPVTSHLHHNWYWHRVKNKEKRGIFDEFGLSGAARAHGRLVVGGAAAVPPAAAHDPELEGRAAAALTGLGIGSGTAIGIGIGARPDRGAAGRTGASAGWQPARERCARCLPAPAPASLRERPHARLVSVPKRVGPSRRTIRSRKVFDRAPRSATVHQPSRYSPTLESRAQEFSPPCNPRVNRRPAPALRRNARSPFRN